jgi:hypothetical protein
MSDQPLNTNDTIQGINVIRNFMDQIQMTPAVYRALEAYLVSMEIELSELKLLRSIVDSCGCRNKGTQDEV